VINLIIELFCITKGSLRGHVKDAEPIMLANSILSLPHQSFSHPLPELSNGNEYEEIRTITYHGFKPALPQFDEENYASIVSNFLLVPKLNAVVLIGTFSCC